MKRALSTATLLAGFLASSGLAQSPPVPAPQPAADMIRETKRKVLQRQLETSLTEKLEIEKQSLSAPKDQQEALVTKAAALAAFIESLERDLQQLAPPQPGTAPSQTPGPEVLRKAAQDLVSKLQQWRSEKDASLRSTIVKLRAAAADNLKQLAASAEPAASTAMIAEVRRLSNLEPETSLTHAPPMHSLTGIWEHGLSPFRKQTFGQNGLILQLGGTPHGTWTWLDEDQGLFFVDDPGIWMNICRFVNAKTIESVVMNGAQFSYKRKSDTPITIPVLPPSCEVMTKLTAAEQSLRDLAALAWQQETEKSLAALDSAIQELSEPDRSEFSRTAARLRLDRSFEPRTDPTAGLAGKWVLEGRTMEFTSGGIVLVNGEPKGKWLWGKARSRGHIVFTLGAGQLTAIGNVRGDSMELQIIGSDAKHAVKL